MIFLSVLGLFYSFVRARRSRWIMAVLVVLIPGLVIATICHLEFSRPEGWWDWLTAALIVVGLWLSVPIILALSLFSDTSVSFRKKSLDVEIKFSRSRKSNEYFSGTHGDRHEELHSAPLPGK
jgi:hypothetical protein